MKCQHCGEELPEVGDAFCTFCHEELASPKLDEKIDASSNEISRNTDSSDVSMVTTRQSTPTLVLNLVVSFVGIFVPMIKDIGTIATSFETEKGVRVTDLSKKKAKQIENLGHWIDTYRNSSWLMILFCLGLTALGATGTAVVWFGDFVVFEFLVALLLLFIGIFSSWLAIYHLNSRIDVHEQGIRIRYRGLDCRFGFDALEHLKITTGSGLFAKQEIEFLFFGHPPLTLSGFNRIQSLYERIAIRVPDGESYLVSV